MAQVNEDTFCVPINPVVDGRTWNLFDVQFDSVDGVFSIKLCALSFEHAELMLDELKRTGRVIGQLCAQVN